MGRLGKGSKRHRVSNWITITLMNPKISGLILHRLFQRRGMKHLLVRSFPRLCGFFMLFMCVGLWIGLGMAQATETKVVVRALARDGMFIGTSMGGARIIIREADSGLILAQGHRQGDTGHLPTVMEKPRRRDHPLSNAATAKYEARLELAEPTFVSIEGLAPYGQRQSLTRVSTQLRVIPGRDIIGDGVILEFPGFAVDVLEPRSAERVQLSRVRSLSLTVNVVMMCGCPIKPGGIWDADRYEVAGIVKQNGIQLETVPLVYADKTSTFQGTLELHELGLYEVQVYAFDPQTGKAGVDSVMFKVQEWFICRKPAKRGIS
jgi:hypothetical protein